VYLNIKTRDIFGMQLQKQVVQFLRIQFFQRCAEKLNFISLISAYSGSQATNIETVFPT